MAASAMVPAKNNHSPAPYSGRGGLVHHVRRALFPAQPTDHEGESEEQVHVDLSSYTNEQLNEEMDARGMTVFDADDFDMKNPIGVHETFGNPHHAPSVNFPFVLMDDCTVGNNDRPVKGPVTVEALKNWLGAASLSGGLFSTGSVTQAPGPVLSVSLAPFVAGASGQAYVLIVEFARTELIANSTMTFTASWMGANGQTVSRTMTVTWGSKATKANVIIILDTPDAGMPQPRPTTISNGALGGSVTIPANALGPGVPAAPVVLPSTASTQAITVTLNAAANGVTMTATTPTLDDARPTSIFAPFHIYSENHTKHLGQGGNGQHQGSILTNRGNPRAQPGHPAHSGHPPVRHSGHRQGAGHAHQKHGG